MCAENNPLEPYKSPVFGGSRNGGSRIRSARYAMYGAYVCLAITFASIYTVLRLGGDHFFGLVKSTELAWRFGTIASGVGIVAAVVGVLCSGYCLCFGNFRMRLACIIPLFFMAPFFLRVIRYFLAKMLDWL